MPSWAPSRRAPILFTGMGVWSAGTAFVFLNDSAGNDGGAIGQTTYARGGPAALADALVKAARASGAEVRTGAEVTEILLDDDGRAVGVRVAGGETLQGRAIVTATDPKRALTQLVDPVALGPHLVWRARQHPHAGHDGEGEPRAVGDAGVRGRRCRRDAARPHPDRAGHRLPRAVLRRVEVRAHRRGSVHGDHDPVAGRPEPRSRGAARDERARAGGAVPRCARATGRPRATGSATWS